jgi:protein TonB
MFTNLIESDSHRKEFKRRSSFFLATVAAYSLILFAAALVGVLAYDAKVEAQDTDLLVDMWIPPVKPVDNRETPRAARPIQRRSASNATVDPKVRVAERTTAVTTTDNPTKIPVDIGTEATTVPPVTGPVVLSNRNVDPPGVPDNDRGNCVNCPGNEGQPRVIIENEKPPIPIPSKPKSLPSTMLMSKIVSLPKPVYPTIAKQIRAQGPVNVQILVDENGKVVSAHAVAGNATLTRAAEEAAMRARFTPTVLNNQPIKVQGVITYNFVLQ